MTLEDGIAEMIDDFNGGKIQYGGVRVTDPNTNLPKIVFINWVRFCCSHYWSHSILFYYFCLSVFNRWLMKMIMIIVCYHFVLLKYCLACIKIVMQQQKIWIIIFCEMKRNYIVKRIFILRLLYFCIFFLILNCQ